MARTLFTPSEHQDLYPPGVAANVLNSYVLASKLVGGGKFGDGAQFVPQQAINGGCKAIRRTLRSSYCNTSIYTWNSPSVFVVHRHVLMDFLVCTHFRRDESK